MKKVVMVPVIMGQPALIQTKAFDDFTDVRAAGAVHNSASTPGPGTRYATDSGSNITTDGSDLIIAGGTGTLSQTRFALGAQTRAAGLAFIFNFTVTNTPTTGIYIGWATQQAVASSSNFSNRCLRIGNGAGTIKSYDGTSLATIGSYTKDVAQEIALVLRATGCYVFTRGGPYDATRWTLLYVYNVDSTATLYPAIATYDTAVLFHSLTVAQYLLTGWINDTIYLAKSATPSAGDELTGSMADMVTEFTWTPGANETLNYYFRYTDANNTLKLVCDQAAGTIKLYRVLKGVATEIAAGKTQTWTVASAYKIVAVCDKKTVATYVNNIAKHPESAITYSQGYPYSKNVKVDLAGANLLIYPRRLVNLQYAHAYDFDLLTPWKVSQLDTPTYDGSGQAVHPSVLYFASGWNGHKYWMCLTPYPEGNEDYENPSILVSEDGTTWTVPNGLTNPIVAQPAGGYNADGEIVMTANGLTMWCLYKVSVGGEIDIRGKSSTDGVTWSAEVTIIDGTTNLDLSPAVVWDGSQFVMYSTDYTSGADATSVFHRRTCATINGTWSAPSACTMDAAYPAGEGAWHQDVIYEAGRFWGLFNFTNKKDYLAYSDDGSAWTRTTNPVIDLTADRWDNAQIYRGSLIRKDATHFAVWYSANGTGTIWHIGYVEIEQTIGL